MASLLLSHTPFLPRPSTCPDSRGPPAPSQTSELTTRPATLPRNTPFLSLSPPLGRRPWEGGTGLPHSSVSGIFFSARHVWVSRRLLLHDESGSGTGTNHVSLEGEVTAMTGCRVHSARSLLTASCLTVLRACCWHNYVVFPSLGLYCLMFSLLCLYIHRASLLSTMGLGFVFFF